MRKIFTLFAAVLFAGSMTMKAEKEIYAALSTDEKTMTLYYDEAKSTRSNVLANWTEDMGTYYVDGATRSSVTSIVIDGSMADALPTRTYDWFYGFENATSIINLSDLHTDNVTNMRGMFWNCKKLTSLDLSQFNTTNVENMDDMFNGCVELTSLNVSGFNTANVKKMDYMFMNCKKLQSLDLSDFNTGKVEDMSWMFYHCEALESLTIDKSQFNTANVTKMDYMFSDCEKLASLDVSGFNTENVTTMEFMFDCCNALTSLDVSGFDTKNVTNMQRMFGSCRALTSLDVSGFNTANVTDMSGMFRSCDALTSLDVSGFDTKQVTSMWSMFSDCDQLTSLDVSNFNIEKVEHLNTMFWYCSSLETIYCNGDWSSSTAESNRMFAGCEKLVGGNNTVYDENYVDAAYAIQDGLNGKPGYFTKKASPQTKEMTPTIGHLGWDEKDQQWSITVYEYAGEDPKFVFAFAVDGAKNVLPTTMTLTNSTEDSYVFSDIVNPEDFSGSIKDASLTITYEGTGYQYDNVGDMYYVNAKISGEMSDADGNKLIVKEPTNFIKLFVPSDITTGIEGIQPSAISIQKVIRDGQLFILRDGKTYNVQGIEVK